MVGWRLIGRCVVVVIGVRFGAWEGVGLGLGGVDLGVVINVGVIGLVCVEVIDVVMGGGGSCCLCRWKAVTLVTGGGTVFGRLLVVSCCRCLVSVVGGDLMLLVDFVLLSFSLFSCASLVNDGKDRLMTSHASSCFFVVDFCGVTLLGSDGVDVSWANASVKMSVACSKSCWTCSWNCWTSLCCGRC